MSLTNIPEQPKQADFSKFQLIPDKIEAKIQGEPHVFISLLSVNNRQDANTAKKVINEIAQKVLGYTYPIVFRRYFQNRVIYEIYVSKYYVFYDGKLEDTYELLQRGIDLCEDDINPKWIEFKKQINQRLGAGL